MTPKEAANKIRGLTKLVRERINDGRTIAFEDYEGKQKQRIFNNGKDSFGETIQDGYSRRWAKKRQEKGRQIAYKDLMYEGDLEKGMVKGTTDGRVTYGFINDKERNKAAENEIYTNKQIFFPNPDEVKEIVGNVWDYIMEGYDRG